MGGCYRSWQLFALMRADWWPRTAPPIPSKTSNRPIRISDPEIRADCCEVFPDAAARAERLEAWKQVVERGYEGLRRQGRGSVYEGGATRRWVKVKQRNWTLEEDRWQRRIFEEGRP
jgi:hypothetical protein